MEGLLKQWACRSIELSTVYLGKSYQSSQYAHGLLIIRGIGERATECCGQVVHHWLLEYFSDVYPYVIGAQFPKSCARRVGAFNL